MWTMRQVDAAFTIFKQMSPKPDEIEVWFSDMGLYVFNVPSPAEMRGDDHPTMIDSVRATHTEMVRVLEEDLSWTWESEEENVCGEASWKLFRSD